MTEFRTVKKKGGTYRNSIKESQGNSSGRKIGKEGSNRLKF